jgi:hypothetical protein
LTGAQRNPCGRTGKEEVSGCDGTGTNMYLFRFLLLRRGGVSRPVHYTCIDCIDFCCFDEEDLPQEMQIVLGPANPASSALAFRVEQLVLL